MEEFFANWIGRRVIECRLDALECSVRKLARRISADDARLQSERRWIATMGGCFAAVLTEGAANKPVVDN
jgi:hypothetical protein